MTNSTNATSSTRSTTSTDPADRLAGVLAPPLRALDVTLYDVELSGSGRGRTLRVLVDADGGVDLDAITAATQALGPVLDTDPVVAALLPGTYLLEVSSPGLERPLRTPAHFRRAVGTPISLKARAADGTVGRERALVVGADDESVEVEIDGVRTRVGYADVVQARTVFEWGPAPKPGQGAAKAAQGGKSSKPGPAAAKRPKSTPTVTTKS